MTMMSMQFIMLRWNEQKKPHTDIEPYFIIIENIEIAQSVIFSKFMVSRIYLTELETKGIIHYDGYRIKLTVRITNGEVQKSWQNDFFVSLKKSWQSLKKSWHPLN